MTKSKKIVLLVAIVAIIALMVMAGVTGGSNATVDCPDCDGLSTLVCETCGTEGIVRGSLWALLPPLIAIGLALITKELCAIDSLDQQKNKIWVTMMRLQKHLTFGVLFL